MRPSRPVFCIDSLCTSSIVWHLCVLCVATLAWLQAPVRVFAEGWKVRDRQKRQVVILKRFQSIVEKQPDRGFAFQRLVKLARQWPGLDRLVKQYRRKTARFSRNAAYPMILGHLLARMGQRSDALQAYQQATKRAPKNVLAHYYRAQLHQALQQYPQALKAYQQALRYARSSMLKRRCLKALGTLALLMKKPKQALAYWKRFLRMSPKNRLAREEIARALARSKLMKEALTQWKLILKQQGRGAARARTMR
ncbi:MAG: tetratricopeptide repeat protein, partial [Myxococcota bacterium]